MWISREYFRSVWMSVKHCGALLISGGFGKVWPVDWRRSEESGAMWLRAVRSNLV